MESVLLRPCSFAENLIPELISSGPGMSGTMPVTHSQPVTIPACNYSLLQSSVVRFARDQKQVLLGALTADTCLFWSAANTSHEIHCKYIAAKTSSHTLQQNKINKSLMF